MKVSQVYKKKRSLSFEIFPPKKDQELSNIDETLGVLAELNPDFISVTFGAGGSSNCNRTIELAKKIKYEYKIEPVVHLTCLHYDRNEIDSFARVLKDEGIENILALRGDANPNVPAKNDFRHSSDLISYLKDRNDFCFLGACYPECHPESSGVVSEIKSLKKKVDAGAEVLLSQLFFDNEIFYRFHGGADQAHGVHVQCLVPEKIPEDHLALRGQQRCAFRCRHVILLKPDNRPARQRHQRHPPLHDEQPAGRKKDLRGNKEYRLISKLF